MFWLFGQIWLWLLVAFTLGAALTGFLLTTAARRRAPAPAIDDDEADTSYEIQRGDLGLTACSETGVGGIVQSENAHRRSPASVATGRHATEIGRRAQAPTPSARSRPRVPNPALDEETLSGNEIPPHQEPGPAPRRWPDEPEWPHAEQESPPASDRFKHRT